MSRTVAARLLDLVCPRKCVVCRRILDREPGTLCSRCRPRLIPPEKGPKRGEHYRECVAAFSYEGALRQAMLRYKFGGKRVYARTFGQLLADALRARPELAFDCVTYVPLSKARRKQRGYDQAGLLARALGKELGVPVLAAVRKVRDTAPQSRISGAAARRANIQNAYRPLRPEAWAGKRLLLVDDILTTGATLSEVSRILLQAGAASVSCAVLGKTPSRQAASDRGQGTSKN